jgi:hypothetical protein
MCGLLASSRSSFSLARPPSGCTRAAVRCAHAFPQRELVRAPPRCSTCCWLAVMASSAALCGVRFQCYALWCGVSVLRSGHLLVRRSAGRMHAFSYGAALASARGAVACQVDGSCTTGACTTGVLGRRTSRSASASCCYSLHKAMLQPVSQPAPPSRGTAWPTVTSCSSGFHTRRVLYVHMLCREARARMALPALHSCIAAMATRGMHRCDANAWYAFIRDWSERRSSAVNAWRTCMHKQSERRSAAGCGASAVEAWDASACR